MCQKIADQLNGMQSRSIGKILTVAEACMGADQFRAFKRLVMDELHGQLKPATRRVINDALGQVGKGDRIDKKGGCPMSG